MPQFEPQVPQVRTLEELIRYVQDISQELVRCFGGVETIILPELHVEPAKHVNGHLVYADGVSWNPGAGRGVYRYDSSTASWHFLG